MSPEPGLGVYVHIPFCLRKCPYCDFASVRYHDGLADRYLDALRREIDALAPAGRPAATVYIGGGTPTTLGPERLGRLVEWVRSRHEARPDAEVTIEANPGAFDPLFAEVLLDSGVNRVSVGVQSFDGAVLKSLGRIHCSTESLQALAVARRFPTWSLDLMFGVMGQSLEQAVRDARLAVESGASHVSAYCLSLEEGTPLHARVSRGLTPAPDPGLQRAMFDAVGDTLEAAGLRRYEISNFARPGHESRHNLAYWRRQEYIGYGASAHSYLGGERRWNVPDPAEYAGRVEAGAAPEAGREAETPQTRYLETLMLGLRMRAGAGLEELARLAARAGEAGFEERGASQEAFGWLERSEGRLRLTRQGLPLADSVIRALA